MDKSYILNYTNEEISDFDKFIDIVIEDVLNTLDREVLLEYKDSQINKLYRKYGNDAFLDPKTKKYPILNYNDGQINKKLVYAAYIDLKRKSGITGTGDLAQKARDLLDENENMFLVTVNEIGECISLIEFIDLIE